jgi:indolepyruvate decarboxylase
MEAPPIAPRPAAAMTVRRFFRRLNAFLDDRSVVICDIGDSLFGAADLTIQRRTEFLSPAYYTSMGFAVPAALGVQLARPRLRPLVVVGDGAFQMTGQELSTIARRDLDPIVFVLNNRGYTTERFIHEGPFNDIHEWAYHRVPDVLGRGRGFDVRTEGDLEAALAAARRTRGAFSIVNVHLDPLDRSAALERLARRLGRRV